MNKLYETTRQRLRINVQGIVQGVGFRPFIYALATRNTLTGFVQNNTMGVLIEIEGTPPALADFQRALREEAPPLAYIISVSTAEVPVCGDEQFGIIHSSAGAERNALISPDTATCDDCLHELFDPADRRYHYPFINCTNCGPRFTIIQDVPYDRDKTTMSVFALCPDCQREYLDPLNRRFHAQPNACPVCGPSVSLLLHTEDAHNSMYGGAFVRAAQELAGGAILVIKGLGGYHLACDAFNREAVQRLRQRKHREAKPFALMVRDLETAALLCKVNTAEAALLQSRQRPIVLLEQREDVHVAPDVAPAQKTLGIMLPYTPLHHLLLQAYADVFSTKRPVALVMTSGNVSDEPIAYRDDDAKERLATIADGTLVHNRTIHMRCDDSVMRVTSLGNQFLRRSRGFAPEPIPLPFDVPIPLLACGGHLKNTFCLGKGKQAFVSHHIGDLENLETLVSFREGIEHFQRLFDIYPKAIVYDLHPEYLATKYALDTAIPQKIGVQHHYAHIASVMAEHGLTEPVIGVAADGTGYGTDGAIWGCEVMVADLLDFKRLAHLAYVPLPGGDRAVQQPWRMAATYLAHVYGEAFLDLDIPFVHQLDRKRWHVLSQMISRGLNSPQTSSLGRLFDAVAALIGLRGEVLYEGQAAIELEALAKTYTGPTSVYPFLLHPGQPATLDVTTLLRALVKDMQEGASAASMARCFHSSVATMFALSCDYARQQTNVNKVALSGGVFQNQLLLEDLSAALQAMEFQVYTNRLVPPNDGGISLGQLAVAAARLRQGMY